MKKVIPLFLLTIIYTGFASAQSVIPLPAVIMEDTGFFKIPELLRLRNNGKTSTAPINFFLNNYKALTGREAKLDNNKYIKNPGPEIALIPVGEMEDEEYSLLITKNGIVINAVGDAGFQYGLETLLQLIVTSSDDRLHCMHIEDKPKFSYRGMHLDVCRHFFNVAEVKKYLDLMALYKFNKFHWHLTDDQGWRIEIKKYPRLTSIGGWRTGTLIGHLNRQPQLYDNERYGGFYTQEEIKEVIEYASQLQIEVIPEIEMPGHALAALAAYPEYSCTNDSFEVGKRWGIFKDIFCPKEETFTFLENILDEVIALFPGKYIHIGGDEVPKDRWKDSDLCQGLIKKLDLKDEEDLQRYFTNRIINYLSDKGKIGIGWDEALSAGLDSNAVIMSWLGYRGAALAAMKGHKVIMSPYNVTYFDNYQSLNTAGSIAIGGYIPLTKVYGFELVPDVLSAEQASNIIGGQANMWTEYVKAFNRIEEMVLPRMAALSEVLWTPKEKRNYNSFVERLNSHFHIYDTLNLNYSKALYEIVSRITPKGSEGVNVELVTSYPSGEIRYTNDSSEVKVNSPVASGKIPVVNTTTIRAGLFIDGKKKGDFVQRLNINKATGKEVTLRHQPHAEFNSGGVFSLVNGVTGRLPWLENEWLGFLKDNFEAVIDLGSVQAFSKAAIDFLNEPEGGIFPPTNFFVYGSDDQTEWKQIKVMNNLEMKSSQRLLIAEFMDVQFRYVKIIAENRGVVPEGYDKAGKDAFLFIDEIVIE